jgi:hypothetical protein
MNYYFILCTHVQEIICTTDYRHKGHHDITEILLKVALNTITLTLTLDTRENTHTQCINA